MELGESIKALVQIVGNIAIAAGVYTALRRVRDESLWLGLLRFLAFEAGVVSMFSLYQEYRSSAIASVLGGRLYFTLFGDPNYYAGYLLMALSVAIGLLIVEKRRLVKVAYAGICALLAVSVISTVSRSALAVFVLLVVVYASYFLFQRGRKKLVSLVVFGVTAALIAVVFLTNIGSTFVDVFTLTKRVQTVLGGKDASVEQRQLIIGVGKRMMAAHPAIGCGIGNFEKSFDVFRLGELSTGNARAAHNTYVRLMVETGALGTSVTALLAACFVFLLLRGVIRCPDERRRMHLFSVFIALCTFFLMSATLDQFMEPHFWVMAGIALAMNKEIPALINEEREASSHGADAAA